MTDPNDSIYVSEKWSLINGPDGPESCKIIAPGLTKREYFSSLAMQGIIASGNKIPGTVSELAIEHADRLIKELNNTQE